MNIKALRTTAIAIFAIVATGHATSAHATSAHANEKWNDRMTFYSVVHSSPGVAASFRGTPAATAQIGRSDGSNAFADRAAQGSDFWWLHREDVRENSSGR